MAPPGGDMKFVFHRSKSTFPALSHAKKHFLHIFIQKKVFELTYKKTTIEKMLLGGKSLIW